MSMVYSYIKYYLCSQSLKYLIKNRGVYLSGLNISLNVNKLTTMLKTWINFYYIKKSMIEEKNSCEYIIFF